MGAGEGELVVVIGAGQVSGEATVALRGRASHARRVGAGVVHEPLTLDDYLDLLDGPDLSALPAPRTGQV